MKNKLFILLLIPLLLLVTACENNIDETDNDKIITKTLELSDSKLGFTTTFKYNSDLKFTNIEESNGEKSKKLFFECESLDFSMEISYDIMPSATYNSNESSRATKKYYKEHTFGDFEAYAYGDEKKILNLNILLGINEDDKAEVLVVTMNRLDNDSDIVMEEILTREELQKFFSSIEFVKE